MEKINLLMFIGYITLACGAVCVRKSPNLMRTLAAWLKANADADDDDKENRQKLHAQCRKDFKLIEKRRGQVVTISEANDV